MKKNKRITLDLELIGEKGSDDDDTDDRYLTLLATLEGNLMRVSTTPEDSSIENSSYISSKLPCLEIPIYDGKDVSMYKSFIEMFRAIIHFDSRISDIQKLCFLRKYLKGEPLTIIDNLPIIGKSYQSALELLDKRYDNPALLVNGHVTSLLDLPT